MGVPRAGNRPNDVCPFDNRNDMKPLVALLFIYFSDLYVETAVMDMAAFQVAGNATQGMRPAAIQSENATRGDATSCHTKGVGSC